MCHRFHANPSLPVSRSRSDRVLVLLLPQRGLVERDPTATRTKKGTGTGTGATINLSIDYYRSPDGLKEDFGAFSGVDGAGAWELHFEGTREFDAQLGRVIGKLRELATEAREDTADPRNAGRTVWLKTIGAQDARSAEIWWDERNRDDGVDFPYRPKGIRRGDLLVVYASGTGKVVGVMEVTGDTWYKANRHPRWPYRLDTTIPKARAISEGEPLDSLSDERQIGKSIRQKSHIRLSDTESARALALFGVENH